MTRSEAEQEIQERLARMRAELDDVRKIADEHKIEFSFLGSQMHYTSAYSYGLKNPPLAKTGFFIADDLWQSSSFGCGTQRDAITDKTYDTWSFENFPENYDEDYEPED